MPSLNKIRYNGEDYDINSDSLPIGTIVEYEGDTVPDGYEEVEDEGEIYSTEEVKVGTWLDGKPIYKNTFQIEIASTGNQNFFDKSELNIDNVIKMETVMINEAFNVNIPYYVATNDYIGCWYDKMNKRFVFISSKNIGNCYVTIYYTKVTD